MSVDRLGNLNRLIYSYKDAFSARKEFKLCFSVVNMVTKVYSEKIGHDTLTFLVAPSYFDKTRELSIVHAGLTCLGNRVQSDYEIDMDFSEKLQDFLNSTTSIILWLVEDCIYATSKYSKIELIKTMSDEPAKQMLLRSLCIFFACCEKEVTNNIDLIVINDYGRVV